MSQSSRQILNFTHSTLVTGVSTSEQFLVAHLNGNQIGIPLYTITNSDLSFIFPQTDIEITGTLVDSATAYGAGVSMYVNSSGMAVPIFQVDTQSDVTAPLEIGTPTLVSNLSTYDQFVTLRVNNAVYGMPLYDWTGVYPFNASTSTTPSSSTNITTVLLRQRTKNQGEGRGSTNLNNKIQAYSHLIDRIKYQLGWPYIQIEVCEDVQIVDFIDQAIEWYTKYAGYTEEYLIFNSDLYQEPGLRIDRLFTISPVMRETFTGNLSAAYDYDLEEYRKVIGVFSVEQGETTGINTLFTLEQAMAQQTYFSYMLGNVGFDLVTWEVLKGWLDLREKVLAQTIYVDFDQRNQLLRLIPPPYTTQRYYGVVGAWVEKPIRDLIMERWVFQYALALTKIAIGNIRGKFQNIQLFGGGTINYNDLLSQGLEEKKQLEEELMQGYGEVTPARFWIG